jgi:5,10-methylene-tetrahydrofolate dehydrogenase/methenyl tetrahydrofolate cyclohydrolase
MKKEDYFFTQIMVAEVTNLVVKLPLKELAEEMEAAKLIAPVSDLDGFKREERLLTVYQELTTRLLEFQTAVKGIAERNGVKFG